MRRIASVLVIVQDTDAGVRNVIDIFFRTDKHSSGELLDRLLVDGRCRIIVFLVQRKRIVDLFVHRVWLSLSFLAAGSMKRLPAAAVSSSIANVTQNRE